MKESSCLSPKMATYCQEVRQLENKFDGLELNHIPRWLNEAADTLAKMASNCQPVPSGIFASDQYKPSICYEEPEQPGDDPPTSGMGVPQPPTLRSWSSMRSQWWSVTLSVFLPLAYLGIP
jgi:hypothetical protein